MFGAAARYREITAELLLRRAGSPDGQLGQDVEIEMTEAEHLEEDDGA